MRNFIYDLYLFILEPVYQLKVRNLKVGRIFMNGFAAMPIFNEDDHVFITHTGLEVQEYIDKLKK